MLGSKRLLQKLIKFARYCKTSARISSNREDLIIKINQHEEHYPLVWLRDNCRCSKCFHFDSQSRIINWNEFEVDVKAKLVETQNDTLVLTWEDQHKSSFNLNWLQERSFSKENRRKFLKNVYNEPKIVWGKDDFANFQKYDYDSIINDQGELCKYLNDLMRYGVALVKNTCKNKDDGLKLANQIGFPRKTHYGESFDVVAKPGTSNVSYLPNFLQLHTDLPYYELVPGVILLHCIEQTESIGGENLLGDSFYVAEKLRQENKDVFDILASVEVNWLDIGQDGNTKFHSMHRSPMITLDSEGNIDKIRHSIPQRDSRFTIDLKYVKPWYQALKTFLNLLNEQAFKLKTKPGEILAIDNTRIAHGRLGYSDTDNNVRLLVGHYVDWDEIYSKLRVLKQNNTYQQ